MIALPETIALPLEVDDRGIIRVSGTRIALDTILACYHQGDSPEAIHQAFEAVPLHDIYAVIAYYLANRAEIDAYLDRGQQEAERLRQQWEARLSPEQSALQTRIRSLMAARQRETDG